MRKILLTVFLYHFSWVLAKIFPLKVNDNVHAWGKLKAYVFPLPVQVKVIYINLVKQKIFAEMWVSKKKGWKKKL